MSNIIQNMKSGFANMKELFGIFLSVDDNSEDDYSIYINSKDNELSKTAEELKKIEESQEAKRLYLFNAKISKGSKKKFEQVKTIIKNESSQNSISNDIHISDDKEPVI